MSESSVVERTVVLDAPADEVWGAISDDARLAGWLADEVELEPVEGSEARFRVGNEERVGTVERVEEGHRLAFTWARKGEPETYVELVLDSIAAGTQLRVIEVAPAFVGTSASAWRPRLSALAATVSLVAA